MRYILEGSAQKSEDRIRISAQLIDGTTGHTSGPNATIDGAGRALRTAGGRADETSWARLLRPMAGGWARPGKRAEERRPAVGYLEALDYFQRGMEFLNRFTKEDNKRRRRIFPEGIRDRARTTQSPSAKLAMALMIDVVFDWSGEPDYRLGGGLEVRGLGARTRR